MGRRKTSLVALKEISEINMTPLMDLTFILLITFIITFPLIEQGIPVNLPKGKAADLDNPDTRSITIDAVGTLFLDDEIILKEDLAGEMQRTGQLMPDTTVYVRADQSVEYGRVAEVVKMLYDAKVTRMALVTEAEN
ncbi:ExbD/TolR family protein [Tichowtungia aerotolerans]|uniref:Biopolymer transporter ExbD n=1 Tax=Tichowtungia aerotolerans TaxID=2697043 RepID=A0A6P1M9I4_9BACT|nr:biopolymer transporter ExbD [Tichowtungia aerotolerans]QHI69224.1 biopolymer transporter ExbD [Tichowtungia aerotolerans]